MSRILTKLNYEDITIVSPQDQIRKMVASIYDNIKIYTDSNDIFILKRLEELCIDRNMQSEIYAMQRNIGMYHFYKGNINSSIISMNKAIDSMSTPRYLVEWKSDLGLMHFLQCDYGNARKLFEEVKKLLTDNVNIDEKILHLYYYRYGVLENNTKNHHMAEIYFRKSLEYALSSSEIGDSITSIGLSFKLRDMYDEAIKYYNEALEVFDDNLGKSKVYNNLATLYKSSKEYEKALHYIKLALDYIDNKNIKKQFIFYHTYAEISIKLNKNKEALNKLFELATLTNVENIFTYKLYVIEAIQTLVDYCKMTDNIEMLESIHHLIKDLVEETSPQYEHYLNSLYAFLGDIRHHIMGKKQKEA